jgi:hypothetical protein
VGKSESEIGKEIQEYLTALGVEWYWRNQVYTGRVKSGSYMHTGKTGVADIIIVEFGHTIYVETKKPGEKQSPEQIEFQAHCIKNNQQYWLVYSLADVERKIKELGV